MNINGQGHSLNLVQGHTDSRFSNFFFLETAWPIEAKFHVKPPCDGGRKFVQLVQVTWSRWPPCPCLVKTLKNLVLRSPEPKGRWPGNLVCSIGCSSITKFVQMMTLGWPWPSPLKSLGWLKPNFMWSLLEMRERKFVKTFQDGHHAHINIKKSSSVETKGLWPWNLLCSIGCSSTTKFVQMMTLGWPWPILRQDRLWSLILLYGKR